MATRILEINLISAQGLKLPSSTKRRLQTYALAWVNPSTKLRTRVDRVGGDNPTWNDKFFFKVTPEFLSSETSTVSVEIYATGYIRDPLIGSVRFLVSNVPLSDSSKTPSFAAFQIRRPSGRVHGLLNIGAMLIEGADFAGLKACSAIGYRDLMGESVQCSKQRVEWLRKSKSMADELNAVCSGSESLEDSSCAGSPSSDGGDSTTSSSSTASTALKEWNGSGIPGLARKHRMRSISAGMLCGLLMDKKNRSSPSDQNLDG